MTKIRDLRMRQQINLLTLTMVVWSSVWWFLFDRLICGR